MIFYVVDIKSVSNLSRRLALSSFFPLLGKYCQKSVNDRASYYCILYYFYIYLMIVCTSGEVTRSVFIHCQAYEYRQKCLFCEYFTPMAQRIHDASKSMSLLAVQGYNIFTLVANESQYVWDLQFIALSFDFIAFVVAKMNLQNTDFDGSIFSINFLIDLSCLNKIRKSFYEPCIVYEMGNAIFCACFNNFCGLKNTTRMKSFALF